MGLGFLHSLLFLLLITIMSDHGDGAREMATEDWKKPQIHCHENNQAKLSMEKGTRKANNVLRLHSMDDSDSNGSENDELAEPKHVHAHSPHHLDHLIDAAVLVFFTLEDLKLGMTMPVYFPHTNLSSAPHLLPREEADSIPFSVAELPNLLQFFSFSQGSPQAKAMADTLGACESKSIKGETKFCATSAEVMLDFVSTMLGKDTQIKILRTTHLTKSNTHLQNYTVVEEPRDMSVPKMVACHTMPYPYAIFYCHRQETGNKVYKVLLEGENGDTVEAVAVCHLDTSEWSPSHISFRVLGIQPGTSPVCHFFPADHLVWV